MKTATSRTLLALACVFAFSVTAQAQVNENELGTEAVQSDETPVLYVSAAEGATAKTAASHLR